MTGRFPATLAEIGAAVRGAIGSVDRTLNVRIQEVPPVTS